MREEKEQKIAEIRTALYLVENGHQLQSRRDFHANAQEYVDFLLSEIELSKRKIHNLKRRLKGCEERNRCLGRDQKNITEGKQWIKKRHEEAWTYEPGTGEVVEEILRKLEEIGVIEE